VRTIYLLPFITLILTSCPGGQQNVETNVTSAIEGRGGQGITAGCSMSDEPGLQRALTLNSQLTNAVADSATACQNSVAQLNGDSIHRSMQQLYENREQIEDISVTISNYESEVARLSSNNPGGVYDSLIAELEMNLATARRQVRTNRYGADRERRESRRRAMESLPSIVGAYDSVLANCSGENHQAVASMAQSGLAFASSLAGSAGASAQMASMLIGVATSLQNFIPTMEDRIQNNLESARVPYILTCGVEAMTASFCEVDRQLTNLRFREEARPEVSCDTQAETSLTQEFVGISQLLPELEGLYARITCEPTDQECQRRQAEAARAAQMQAQAPSVAPTGPEAGSGIDENTAIYSARADSLYNNLDQISSYLDSIERQAEDPLESASERLNAQRRSLLATSRETRAVVSEIRERLNSETALGQSAELFTDPRFNLFNQIESINELHRQVMRRGLIEESDGRDLSSLEQENLFILSDDSALQAAANVMTRAPQMGMPPRGEDSIQGLSHAYRVAGANIEGFSNFVDGNVDLASIVQGIRGQASSSQPGSNGAVASATVANQLCGASLSLHRNSPIPEDLVASCQDIPPLGGKSYRELAALPWEQRVCLPVNLGIIGQ
jgi:hypothetical protein